MSDGFVLRIAKLEAEIERLCADLAAERKGNNLLRDDRDDHKEEIDRLRKALEFYAHPMHWSVDGTFLKADKTGKRADLGKTAQEALNVLACPVNSWLENSDEKSI